MYKRILLKISGKSLKKKNSFININIINHLIKEIKKIIFMNIQLSIVIGGGNIFRGNKYKDIGTDRITADKIGMISTIINGLILANHFRKKKINTEIMSAINISGICNIYNTDKALEIIKKKKILIITAGTGNHLFSTDSAACLRAIEINADLLIKATDVNGIYTKDPKKYKSAKFIKKISYKKIIKNKIKIMDITSFFIAKKYKLPIYIVNIYKKNFLYNILNNKDMNYTIIN